MVGASRLDMGARETHPAYGKGNKLSWQGCLPPVLNDNAFARLRIWSTAFCFEMMQTPRKQ